MLSLEYFLLMPVDPGYGRSPPVKNPTTDRDTKEPTIGIEPMNLILTKDALYQLSYVGL